MSPTSSLMQRHQSREDETMLTRATTEMADQQSAPLSTTRRRAITSPTPADFSDKDNLLHHTSAAGEGADDTDTETDDSNLTLMEQVVLMGIKDQQGYLSFMNDTISYVLRGCIIMELAVRKRVKVVDSAKNKTLPERHIDLVDGRPTGEVLLDETMKLMKMERHSIGGWIDLLSGETWNPMKVNLQLKQVRERIAKGLVDKGVLRTEKHSFYHLFDMATHPVTDHAAKAKLAKRVLSACTGRGAPASLRTVCLVAACHAANVIDGACLHGRSFLEREAVLQRADEMMRQHAQYRGDDDVKLVVAGVLTVLCRLDSLLY